MADIILHGNETTSVAHTAPQVYWATHNGSGELLPGYLRSFISFSYGEKNIEDFGLIAYCNGSTMERAGSAEFEDLTTSYDILDGETYHGTHFKPFQLSLSLATDGMTQKQLEQFKSWFRGGVTRQLVLAEHPNRFIYARLQSPPQFHLIPFQMPFTMPLNVTEDNPYDNTYGLIYNSFSTLYKGTIDITFISSDPFWKAFGHVIGTWQGNEFTDTYEGQNFSNDNVRRTITKIVYEDNIPLPTMAMGSTRMAFGRTGKEIRTGERVIIASESTPVNTQNTVNTRSLTRSSSVNRDANTLTPTIKDSQLIVVEAAHRPIALPVGEGVLQRFDTVIAFPKPKKDGEADASITGEFKWWDPWDWRDTFNASLTGEDFINQYPDRDFISYRGARIARDDAQPMIIDGFYVNNSISGSFIVDAYVYPQILGSNKAQQIYDDEENVPEEEEEEEIDEDGRGIPNETRGEIVITTRGGESGTSTGSDEGTLTPTPTIDEDDDDDIMEEFSSNGTYYFFYGGTAPSPARICFSLPIRFTPNSLTNLEGETRDKRLIDSIASSYCLQNNKAYSTITIEGTYKKEISMSTPNIITSYNKVIDIIKNCAEMNVVDLEEKFRDEIRHPWVRAYVLKALTTLVTFKNEGGSFDQWTANTKYKKNAKVWHEDKNGRHGYICTKTNTDSEFDSKKWKLYTYTVIPANKYVTGSNKQIPTITSGQPDRRVLANMMSSFWLNNKTTNLVDIVIDSNISKATGKFNFNTNPDFKIRKLSGSYWLTYTLQSATPVERTEDIGDAMRSTWYYIDERNEFKEIKEDGVLKGYSVEPWTSEHKEYSHKVTNDFPVALKNFSVDYEYMYF